MQALGRAVVGNPFLFATWICVSADLNSPHHPLSSSTGTHTYLSFSYKKQKGVYMTMYYSPRVYSTKSTDLVDAKS